LFLICLDDWIRAGLVVEFPKNNSTGKAFKLRNDNNIMIIIIIIIIISIIMKKRNKTNKVIIIIIIGYDRCPFHLVMPLCYSCRCVFVLDV